MINNFLYLFTGVVVVIEMKDDSEISGILDDVDKDMNVVLSNCRQVGASGEVSESDTAHINGRKIRYVHIPPDIKPSSAVTNYIRKVDRIRKQSRPGPIRDSKPSSRLYSELEEEEEEDEIISNCKESSDD